MPRKTKEQKELEIEKELKKKSDSKTKKSTKSAKKDTEKVAKSDKTTKSSKVIASNKKTTKASTSKTKTTTTKKASKAKSSSKSASTKKREIVEYYDLPHKYNQTVVKLLAQTPTTLFIYWEISDSDIEKFKEEYGENFFETTRPVIIVHNDSLNYSFEVEINDFANSWYLHVADSKCDYRIELGRRPIQKTEKLNKDYIYISTSNEIESPNDKILFNKEQKMVYFRNIKTGEQSSHPVNNLSFISNIGKVYHIYDLYQSIYKDTNIEEIYDLSNPSSGSLNF